MKVQTEDHKTGLYSFIVKTVSLRVSHPFFAPCFSARIVRCPDTVSVGFLIGPSSDRCDSDMARERLELSLECQYVGFKQICFVRQAASLVMLK